MQKCTRVKDTGVLPASFPSSQQACEGGKRFPVAQTRSKAFQQCFCLMHKFRAVNNSYNHVDLNVSEGSSTVKCCQTRLRQAKRRWVSKIHWDNDENLIKTTSHYSEQLKVKVKWQGTVARRWNEQTLSEIVPPPPHGSHTLSWGAQQQVPRTERTTQLLYMMVNWYGAGSTKDGEAVRGS